MIDITSYTISQAMEFANCKRGTVETFRKILLSNGLLRNNRSINQEQAVVLKAVVQKHRNGEGKLKDLMLIEALSSADTNNSFVNLKGAIIPYLMMRLKQAIKIERTDVNSDVESESYHLLFDLFIPNNRELKVLHSTDVFKASMYSIHLNDSIFYLIKLCDKYIHVMYTDSPNFNIMKTTYVKKMLINDDLESVLKRNSIFI